QYLPLRVIKDKLDTGEERPRPRPVRNPVGGLAVAGGTPSSLSRRELLDAAGITEAQLAELETFGLVRRAGRGYGPEALDAVRAMTALGAYGVQARHLRVLLASAERETALIEQVVAPILRQRSPGARDRAGQAAREIAALAVAAHAALVGM